MSLLNSLSFIFGSVTSSFWQRLTTCSRFRLDVPKGANWSHTSFHVFILISISLLTWLHSKLLKFFSCIWSDFLRAVAFFGYPRNFVKYLTTSYLPCFQHRRCWSRICSQLKQPKISQFLSGHFLNRIEV